MEFNDKNSNPFNVPDGYFDELADKMSSFAKAETPRIKVPIRVMIKPLASLAAIIAGVALITFAILKTLPDQKISGNHLFPDEEELFNYLSSEIDIYSLESFAAGEADLQLTTEDDDRKAIIEYLMLSQINISEIIAFLDDDNADSKW